MSEDSVSPAMPEGCEAGGWPIKSFSSSGMTLIKSPRTTPTDYSVPWGGKKASRPSMERGKEDFTRLTRSWILGIR